ncbi:ABC transporter ATP-binding protein [Alicyclobacillus sp. SO9]|uniref:ABC transporter ATP-binding protein n=1 Tax=Alicyclobacillus sp. SO9 TaxID=2665646 RepID=UPI0018E894D7|nr:ATP-binding cassette domain-containing protein [Alicyclobacillus sp. SO9]QQE79787.1 ABC transporter ATP-binding protein [Alicyclobacillus sp. SO9]
MRKIVSEAKGSEHLPLMSFENVSKVFSRRRGKQTVAVNEASFELHAGSITALVGESGSGKSTIGKLVTGVEKPSAGSIVFENTQVHTLKSRNLRSYWRHVQMIFQDPFASLNPHSTVLYTIMRPLVNHRGLTEKQARQRALEIMNLVRLVPTNQFAEKRPHQLSGGQRQRLVIARAIAVEPELVVADEPVSMLDVSIRSDILYLIDDLRKRTGMSVLYITHDLLSARVLADEVLVLYKGHIVERGSADAVIRNPRHPYTRLLLEAIPNPWRHRHEDGTDTNEHSNDAANEHSNDATNEQSRSGAKMKGSKADRISEHVSDVAACPFHQRCELATDKCRTEKPGLSGDSNHQSACFYM